MYLTLTELKSKLQITGTDRDDELNLLLDKSRELIKTRGYDFTSQDYTYITRRENWYRGVAMDHPNVTNIVEVSGKGVTYQNKIDFLVKGSYNHIVVIGSPSDVTWNYGTEIEVKYTAGLTDIPSTLSDAQFYIVCGFKSDDTQALNLFKGGKEVKDFTQGPRRVSYDTTRSADYYYDKADEIFKTFFNPIELA